MSRVTAGKIDPKIPKREVMVTRHKSAQMKRQLRDKDRSMKHVTDLLKSPTKDSATKTAPVKKKQSSPKAKQSLLKSVEKIQNLPQKTFKLSKVLRKEILLAQNEEFHPNKRKRKLNVNKVVLKPKSTVKVVGEISGSVKRKYAVPQKTIHEPEPQATPTSKLTPKECIKLSMTEAIRIMDEQLTDEDLMEILTCPSPVWWEDPPDEDYIEEALFTRSPSASEKDDVTPENPQPMDVDTDVVESGTDKTVPPPTLSAKSEKFFQKQLKLEKLLGNIKEKTTKQISDNTTRNEDIMVICSNYRANSNKIEVKEAAKISNRLEAKLSESDDELVFHNSSMNDDELLKDLENMDIPIANVIVINDDDDFLDKPSDETKDQASKNEENEAANSDTNREECEDMDKSESKVPKNLPSLKKWSIREAYLKLTASPTSLDSLSSKSSVSSSHGKDFDSISDTNVRFLEEDDDRIKIGDETNKSNNNTLSESNKDTYDDSITVYKIIDEENELSTSNASNESNEKETSCEKVTNEKDILGIVDAKRNDYYKSIANESNEKLVNKKDILGTVDKYYKNTEINESNIKSLHNEKDILGIVDTKLNDYYKSIANESDEKLVNEKDTLGTVNGKLNECYKNTKNNESNLKSPQNEKDILGIVVTKLDDYYKSIANESNEKLVNEIGTVDAKLNENYKNTENNESNIKSPQNDKGILGIVDEKLKDYYKNIASNQSKEETTLNEKHATIAEMQSICIADVKINDYYNNIANNEGHEKTTSNEKDILSTVDAKLNDYYKKCKKVYQQKRKSDRTDINKNEMQNVETDFTTVSCDLCKPTFRKVSENENVKYCLKCSSIFDSKDCTYCMKKSTATCVSCKIRFCCENYYKTHACSQTVICMDEISDSDHLNMDIVDTKIRVLSYPST